MKLSDFVFKFLEDKNVDSVFTVSGVGQYTFAIRSVDQRVLNTIAATMSRQFPWQLKGIPGLQVALECAL